MSGNKITIDYNVIINLFRGKIEEKLFFEQNNLFSIPSIVVGELIFGAENSSQPEKHFNQFNDFIKNKEVLIVDKNTAELYGKIKSKLRKNGTPIPENDIWIAALTIQHNLILVTNDNHFKHIKSLKIKEI